MSAWTCVPVGAAHYWIAARGVAGDYQFRWMHVYPSDFEPECMAEALPAMRRLIADDAVRARAHRDWLDYMRLFDRGLAAEGAS